MRRAERKEPVRVIAARKGKETEKAASYLLADPPEWKWFPKSVLEDEDELDDGTVVLEVAAWFAEKEGLADG